MRWVHGPCLKCYANGRKRANYKGHAGYRGPSKPLTLRVWEEAKMKRPTAGAGDTEGVPGAGDTFCNRMALWDMLTCDKYDDGVRRERATLLILCDGRTAKVWLNDRDTGRTAWATGETVDAAMDQLNEQLETDSVSWRTGEGKRPKKSRE